MFTNVTALDSVVHRALRVKPQGFGFAAKIMTVPISGGEFVEAAKYYPIVFPLQRNEPQVLLSLDHDRNRVVTADGRWTVPYIPAHIRRHPFIFSQPDEQGHSIVLIDRDAPSLNDQDGERLFDEAGQTSPLLNGIIDFLRQFQAEVEATRQLVAALDSVLVERQIEIDLSGHPRRVLNGFRTVDVAKFSALPDETVLAWHRNGLLALVHAHLASMTNVPRLAEMSSQDPA